MLVAPACLQCGSKSLYKDGLRYLADGSTVQRWLCRNCGYRFTDPTKRQILKIRSPLNFNCQVGGKEDLPKNLASKAALALAEATEKTGSGHAGATETAEVKGKIIEFLWWAEKQGLSPETIRGYGSCLRALRSRGANLLDPESVKEVIAKEKRWSPNRRRNVISSYTKFLSFLGLSWDKPKCKVIRKLPSFIPMESEIDALIAGSTKLVEMLKNLPKRNERIFPNKTLASLKNTFVTTRKRLAYKLQNPRLRRISFHIIRHWKATVEYHKTKDILYVKNLLGHKKIENTEIYITLEKAIFGDTANLEFHVKVASTPKEIQSLLEVGYEYVCEKDGLLFFRKRK